MNPMVVLFGMNVSGLSTYAIRSIIVPGTFNEIDHLPA